MQLVTEGQIESNEQLLTGCSTEDAALINSDPNLTDQQKFAAMMNPEGYKFQLNNPYINKDVQNYPALFRNLNNPRDFVISRAYQSEFEEYENQLRNIVRTQGSFENAWNSMRVTYAEMDKSDLNAQRMDAIANNDEEKVKELDKKIQDQQTKIDDMTHPSRQGFSGTVGSLLASTGRVLPEMVVTGIATAALGVASPLTGGATAPAAAITAGRFAKALMRIKHIYSAYKSTKVGLAVAKSASAINTIANASYIYNDTANVGRGNMYAYLSEKYPEMSEEEKQNKAWIEGRLEGAFEAGTSFIGLAAIGSRTAYKTAGRAMLMKRGAKAIGESALADAEKVAAKKAFSNLVENGLITSEMANNNSFARGLLSKVIKLHESRLGKVAEFGTDISVEGLTEVYQNEIERTIQELKAGQNISYTDAIGTAQSNINEYVGEMYDYIVNGTQMSENAQDAWDTFKNVALGSAVIGSAFTGVDYASKVVFRNESLAIGNQLDKANKTVATFDKILDQKANSKAGQKSPETLNSFYGNAVKSGEVPETLYMRLDKLKEIITKMKDDPVATAKLNAMKVGQKMAEAEQDGGLVEFDSSDFIEHVVDPKNDTLYQTIKGDISSNPAINSQNDIFELVENIGKSDAMMKEAESDPNSIFNMVLENQKKAGAPDNQARMNATIMQSIFNTFARSGIEARNMADIMQQVSLVIQNVDTITDGDLNSIVGMYTASPRLLARLQQASKMRLEGKNEQEIWEATQAQVDPLSKNMIVEISDKDAKLKNIPEGKKGSLVLSDILDHPDLYEAYPAAAFIPVKFVSGTSSSVSNFGIEILKDLSDKEKLEHILHELTHVTQMVEGLAIGAEPKDFEDKSSVGPKEKKSISYFQDIIDTLNSFAKKENKIDTVDFFAIKALKENKDELKRLFKRVGKDVDLKEFDKNYKIYENYFKKTPFGQYYTTYGEDMARTISEKRLYITEEERKKTPISKSLEFKYGQNLIRYAGGLPQYIDSIRKGAALLNKGKPAVSPVMDQIVGSITFGAQTIIKMSKMSNSTTFAHEGAHLFAHQMFSYYNAGLLSKRWTSNMEKVADYFGFKKDADGKYIFEGDQARAANEKLAEAFTTYLKDGKAPVSYLKEFFDFIKDLFSQVYSAMRMNEVPIDRKVKKVFDEIFVPYEKQKQILLERRYGFIAKPANMTDEQYEKYIAMKRSAASRGQTIDTKLAAKMQEILSNDTYKAEYEAAYRQAFEDLGALPVYQMIDYVIQEKINKASLDKVSKDIKLPRNYVSAKEGLDITQVYAQFTDLVNSPEELARMLAETPSRESAADYAANEHMKEWLQENYPEVAEMDSELASRNEEVFKLAVQEYMMLSGIGMERFNQIHNDMLSVAEYMVQRMPLKKIVNVQRWIEQESKLMQRYDYTLSEKEKAKIKRQQAFLNYYAMRAKQIRQESQRFIRKSRKYRGPQTKDVLKTIDGETFDLLKSMLNKFKLSNSKPNTNVPMGARIDNWVKMMEENNYSAADEISRYKGALVQGVENKLTTADFELLKDAFEFVEAVGKKLKMIQIGEKTVMVENAAQSIADAFDAAGIKPMDKELGMAVMREAVMRELFPDQVFLDFVSPIFKGLTRKDMQIQKWRNELADILKPFGKDLQKTQTIDGRVYTIEQLLVMMLNSGNQHNINCLVKTIQAKINDPEFNEDALFSALDQAPKYLREATRKIWKIFDDNKQAFQEAQTKIDGKVLRFVEAQPYKFSDGEEMQGGYYPAGKVSVIKDYENSQTKFDNSGTYATKSFQKDRSYTHGDLDLTLNTLNSWFYKMAGVLHVAVPYNNMGKLLKNQTFRNAVGEGMTKTLSDWMQLSVSPERTNQFLSAVNQLVSVKILGANPIKMFTQMSGMIPSMAEIGPGYIAKAFLTTNPLNAIQNASELSEYMRARYDHPEDHLQLYMRANNLLGESISKMNRLQFDKVMNFAMYFIIYGDAIASTSTWKAEYARQIDLGKSNTEASELADSAVRRLQGDSSAGSRPPILQGNMRFFTMFSSYFIGIHSMLVAHKIKGDYAKMAGLLFAAAVAAPMFEAIFSTAKDWIGADDDDKKKFKKENIETAMDLYINQSIGNIASSAGAFWLPQFGVGSTLGTAITTGKVYSPRNMQIEYMLKPIEIGVDLVQAASLSSQGKFKKAEQKLKKGLKNIFEFGMINSSVSDRLTNLLIGE